MVVKESDCSCSGCSGCSYCCSGGGCSSGSNGLCNLFLFLTLAWRNPSDERGFPVACIVWASGVYF